MDWISKGTCRGFDPQLWFPEYGEPGALAQEESARQICNSCPMQVNCRDYGIENEAYGVWGGVDEVTRETHRISNQLPQLMSWDERRRLSRARKRDIVRTQRHPA